MCSCFQIMTSQCAYTAITRPKIEIDTPLLNINYWLKPFFPELKSFYSFFNDIFNALPVYIYYVQLVIWTIVDIFNPRANFETKKANVQTQSQFAHFVGKFPNSNLKSAFHHFSYCTDVIEFRFLYFHDNFAKLCYFKFNS